VSRFDVEEHPDIQRFSPPPRGGRLWSPLPLSRLLAAIRSMQSPRRRRDLCRLRGARGPALAAGRVRALRDAAAISTPAERPTAVPIGQEHVPAVGAADDSFRHETAAERMIALATRRALADADVG
jgi:hypothetical protein